MNGEELFKRLSAMKPSERRQCQFWQLTDQKYFNEMADECKDELTKKYVLTDKEWNGVVHSFTSNEIAELARTVQNIESEMEYSYTNGFDETYHDRLMDKLTEKIKCNVPTRRKKGI